MPKKKMDPLEMIATSAFGKAVAGSPVGQAVAKRLGVPPTIELRRGRVLPQGPVAAASVGGGDLVRRTLELVGVTATDAVVDTPESRTQGEDGRPKPPAYSGKLGAIVVDLTGLAKVSDLEQLRAVLRPAVRGLEGSGRVVLVARSPESYGDDLEARVVAQGLDGINRSVGKELRGGATSNLVWVEPTTSPEALASTLRFLLEGRSAYVDGQSWRIGAGTVLAEEATSDRPYEGRVVVVTGAARGIGAAIARTFARDGAKVVCVDIPAAGEALTQVANEIKGTALQLDITVPDAGAKIAEHVAARYDGAKTYAVIHNAGITRDRMLANLDEKGWGQVLDVNLSAQLRMNEQLLDGRDGGLADGGRIIGISSTSGIAGNKGQSNYAASKAAIVGLVRAMAPKLADRGITINAVGPGFIETDMTEAIPFVQREIFKRSNSLQQGGKPGDVAETIAYLADPASAAVTGQVVRVCGQALVGQ